MLCLIGDWIICHRTLFRYSGVPGLCYFPNNGSSVDSPTKTISIFFPPNPRAGLNHVKCKAREKDTKSMKYHNQEIVPMLSFSDARRERRIKFRMMRFRSQVSLSYDYWYVTVSSSMKDNRFLIRIEREISRYEK